MTVARRLAPCGSAVGRQPPAVFRTAGARVADVCLPLRMQRPLPAGWRHAAQRLGGSPRLCFAPQVRGRRCMFAVAYAASFARRLAPCGSCVRVARRVEWMWLSGNSPSRLKPPAAVENSCFQPGKSLWCSQIPRKLSIPPVSLPIRTPRLRQTRPQNFLP